MNKDSRIYVAGHTGLVGSTIVDSLLEQGYNNLILRTHKELDLLNQQDVENFFKENNIEYVFDAAAIVGGIYANNTYRAKFIYDNLTIQNNIIHFSYKYRVLKMCMLGSSCIFPRNCPQPIKEEYLLTGELEKTNEPYAIAKIAGIKMCEAYYSQYGCNFISVMPTNLYGSGLKDNYNLDTSHVLPAMIRKIHLAKCLNENNIESIEKDLNKRPLSKKLSDYGIYDDKLILWGTGNVYREFLHVKDAAEAIIFIMNNYNASSELTNHINIGCGEDITIKQLAYLIKDIIEYKGEILFDGINPDGTPKKLLDVNRIKSMGWSPKIKLIEGIEDTYRSYTT